MYSPENIAELEADSARVRKLRAWLDEQRADVLAPWPDGPNVSFAAEQYRRTTLIATICIIEHLLDGTEPDGLQYLEAMPPRPDKSKGRR